MFINNYQMVNMIPYDYSTDYGRLRRLLDAGEEVIVVKEEHGGKVASFARIGSSTVPCYVVFDGYLPVDATDEVFAEWLRSGHVSFLDGDAQGMVFDPEARRESCRQNAPIIESTLRDIAEKKGISLVAAKEEFRRVFLQQASNGGAFPEEKYILELELDLILARIH